MKAYKGFDKSMQCRGFQFEEGKTYEEESAVLCGCGFHACENPIDVLRYYAPNSSVYREVELDEVSDERENDSKVCARKIKIGAELKLADMIRLGVKIDIKSTKKAKGNYSPAATTGDSSPAATTGDSSPAATTGDCSPAATTGNYSHAATAGDSSPAATTGDCSPAATAGYYSPAATAGNYSHAATTGNYSHTATAGDSSPAATTGDSSPAATAGNCSHAATTGYSSHAATTGDSSHAATTGMHSIAAALGSNSKAKSTVGNWIVLAEYGEHNGMCYPVLCVKAGMIDGETLKPDVWYKLENGEFVEVHDGR